MRGKSQNSLMSSLPSKTNTLVIAVINSVKAKSFSVLSQPLMQT